MEEVYIKTNDLEKCVKRYFENKDIISIDDLLCTIEDLDYEISRLNEKIQYLENKEEYDEWTYSENEAEDHRLGII